MKRTETQPRIFPVALPRRAIDDDAFHAVRHLQREGYTTYLVGGGVRDLLLGRKPKDFDISTAAEPRTVRKLFRNARVIGRRFQIVHLRYGSRIFEVSCFRKREEPPDGGMREPLASENTYGSPRDDAFARDFTVNALFYDPVERQVIDHVGGLEDLDARILRSVGDPRVWFYEDPVRILRAAKFAARIGLHLPEAERAAMRERASLLHICPPSRVTEEVFRILEEGASATGYRILWETGVLDELFPEMCAGINSRGASGGGELLRMMKALDRLNIAHGKLPRDFLYAALFYPALINGRVGDGNSNGDGPVTWGSRLGDWLHARTQKLHIPRAYRARQRDVMDLTERILTPGAHRRYSRIVRQAAFPDAMTILRLHQRLYGDVSEIYDDLRRRADSVGADIVPSTHRPKARDRERGRARGSRSSGRRSSRGRRRRSSGRGASDTAGDVAPPT